MPTIVRTIGSAGGRDYTTLAAWAASLPANLVTDGNSYKGDCYNDSEFTSTGGSSILTLTGHTTDASHTITLTTGPGQSFRDNAGVQTNALRYNQSNGVGITSDASGIDGTISVSDSNVFFLNLQVKNTGYHGTGIVTETSGGIIIDDCIIVGTDIRGALMGSKTTTIRNSLLYTTASPANWIIAGGKISGRGGPGCYFCTIVVPSDVTAPANALDYTYDTAYFENCAIFGAGSVKTGTTAFTFTTCMTDVASPPSGCTGGKTYGSQFRNTTTASGDWRERVGADLQGAGTADSANGAADIVGTMRPQSAKWDIGCWELPAADTIVVADALSLVELLPVHRIERLFQSEIGATQGAGVDMLLEHMATQRPALQVLVERQASRRSALDLQTEFGSGLAGVAACGIEWLAQTFAGLDEEIEWLISLFRETAAPGESTIATARSALLAAGWQGAMVTPLIDDALLTIEWSALPVAMRVSLQRLLASPGKLRILGSPGRLRILNR